MLRPHSGFLVAAVGTKVEKRAPVFAMLADVWLFPRFRLRWRVMKPSPQRATAQGVSEEAALKKGMEPKSISSWKRAQRFTRKRESVIGRSCRLTGHPQIS